MNVLGVEAEHFADVWFKRVFVGSLPFLVRDAPSRSPPLRGCVYDPPATHLCGARGRGLRQTVLRIYDCYLAEGSHVLYRVGLAILQGCRRALLRYTHAASHTHHRTRTGHTRLKAEGWEQVRHGNGVRGDGRAGGAADGGR